MDGDAQRREAAAGQEIVGKSADMVDGALLRSQESLITFLGFRVLVGESGPTKAKRKLIIPPSRGLIRAAKG